MTQQNANRNPEWKRLVGEYNRLANEFRRTWGLLRSMVLVNSGGSEDIQLAKQHIVDLQKKIKAVETPLRSGEIDGVEDSIKGLEIELRVFRELIDKIESAIMPGHIRAFCEKTHDTRDNEIVQLLSYYLSKEVPGDGDLDKIDLLTTELCCTKVGRKRVLKNVYDVDKLLDHIFKDTRIRSEYEGPVITEFKQAVKRIQGVDEIQEILDSDVIATMRDFKKEIREEVANPRILKAMAVYNITFNNKLVEIFEKETTDIKSTSELLDNIRSESESAPAQQRESLKAVIEKIEEIQKSFRKKSEQTGYSFDLIVDAAKHRKAIAEAMDKLKEIQEPEKEEEEGFKRKTTQVLINEVFRALLSIEENQEKKCFMRDLNFDLVNFTPWERSMFLVDLDAMGDERRLFEVVQEALILGHKILAEYKKAKEFLSREEIVELVTENIELAQNLNEELQSLLDKFDPRTTAAIKVIDLMKIKSGLVRNIKRLTSHSRMEGFTS